MRVFWAIIGLLVAVTSVVSLRDGSGKTGSGAPSQVEPGVDSTMSAPNQPKAGAGSDVAIVDDDHEEPDVPSQAMSQATDDAAALATELMAAAEQGTAPTAPASQPVASAVNGQHAVVPAAPKSYEAKVDPAAMELAKHSKIEPQADGSVLIDNKFTVRGSGSVEDPYQLSWELLTSASETYQPRLGLTQIPQRVDMLNGKHVKITGYMAFPLAQMEAKEVLIMLNMWDGCCIGIPPSPYDAIEVQLAEAIPYDKRRFINYGTLTGVMKVDPYLVNDWLLGLYLVEDAKLDFGL